MQHLSSARINKIVIGIIFCLLLFTAYLPLISKVNFMQNDDWYYYSQVQRFLSFNFKLLPQIAPVFYLQGAISTLFSLLFGLNNIPFLTMAIAVLNIFVFYLILTSILHKDIFTSLILSLTLFFNPLFQYSLIGFMTEQYFLFFLLCSLYFFLKFEIIPNYINLIFSNIFVSLGFLVRQVSLVFSLALFLYFLINRKWKIALYQILFTLVMVFLYLLLPKTPEMLSKTYQLQHLLNFHYIYAVFYGSLIYLAAFSIPILILVAIGAFQKISTRTIILTVLFAFVLYFIMQIPFKPMSVSWGEFPYFENTWERTGFMARDIIGTKYQFRGIFDLYKHWDITAKVVLSLFLSTFFLVKRLRKKILSFEAIYLSVYMMLMFLTITFYDRYILVMLPILLIWFAKMLNTNQRVSWLLMGAFALFLAFYSYNFISDFVLRESFVWEKTIKLQGLVSANSAWNEKNNIDTTNVRYIFSYDSPRVGGDKLEGLRLIEENRIEFPLSLFIKPNVYLYERSL